MKPPGSASVCARPTRIRRIGRNGEGQPVGRCKSNPGTSPLWLYQERYHEAGIWEISSRSPAHSWGKDVEQDSMTVAEAPGYTTDKDVDVDVDAECH